MAQRWEIEREGVLLSVLDFGGRGPLVVLLHGLAGYAGEWADTAAWLTADHHVVALDARGQGASTRRPGDVSPVAQVADAGSIVDRVDEGPAVLVGQSLGGVTAMLFAAQRPEVAAALVMVDAAPGEGGNGRVAEQTMAAALSSWPVPFVDHASAAEYFRARFGEGAALPWSSGLEQRDDGLWPRFDVDVMARTLGEMQEPDTWPQWGAVDCPTLVLRAEHGVIDADAVERMRVTRPEATVVEVAGSQHDIHLDRPHEWRQVLTGFLTSAEGPRQL